jgi:DNA-binding transcriptional regulator YiaG
MFPTNAGMIMTADRYREALAALDLSQVGAARLLGVDERTSRRWAIGERDVPPPAERFLRFLIARRIKPSIVIKALGPVENPWKRS